MQIAIASGKGGTGKTTIATNLAHVAAGKGENVLYVDCDVEEPNGHLFLHPHIEESRTVGVPVPVVDESECTGCGLCAGICRFSAIVCLAGKVLTFPELCHGCGGCARVCKEGSITEGMREVGVVERGKAGRIGFTQGRLNVGEAMSPPLIREVKRYVVGNAVNILDAPPGTSCPVISAVQDVDFLVLVTEPTPFGLNDLGLALDMARQLGLRHGVVVNQHENGNQSAREFCEQRGVPVLAEIRADRRVAEVYSRGELASEAVPGYRENLDKLWKEIWSMTEAS